MPLDAIRRIMCHVVLGRLPDRALSEAWESLNDMEDFYSHEPAVPRIADQRKPVKAAIVNSIERPPISLDE